MSIVGSQLSSINRMSNKLSVNHLIGIKDITTDDIELIFSTADNFKDVINVTIKKVH